MPKHKTKKIAAKRFKVSARGAVQHRKQGARHIRRNKSKSRQRRQDKPATLKHAANVLSVKRLLGIG